MKQKIFIFDHIIDIRDEPTLRGPVRQFDGLFLKRFSFLKHGRAGRFIKCINYMAKNKGLCSPVMTFV